MNIFAKIKGWFMKLFDIKEIENKLSLGACLSTEMKEALRLWLEMYAGCAEWHKEAPSCGIQKVITGALADPIVEEIKIDSDNEALLQVMQQLQKDAATIIEYFVNFGSCVIRPVFSSARVQYEIVHLGNYLPLAYDLDGTLTSAVITKLIQDGGKDYLLAEKHEYANKIHTVTTKLYKYQNGALGAEVSLEATTQTAAITPSFTWHNVERPFIIELRNKEPNKIDGSNAPCALIAGAENLIKDADEQYARLIWEVEAGKTRVFADSDLFEQRQSKNGDGLVKLSPTLKKLFVKLNGDGTGQEKITTFSPSLRTTQQIEALNEIFRRIELATNIGKGTISNLESVAQTATQFAGGKKAFYSKVDKYESELEEKYIHCAYVFAYMLSAYTNTPFNEQITISYNDMTRKDPKELKEMALREVAAGIMSKAEYRMMFYGETEEEAQSKLPVEETQALFGNY